MTFYYLSSSGEQITLDTADSLAGYQGGIDGHRYTYDLTNRGIEKAALLPRDVTVPYTGSWEQLDRLLKVAEADIIAKKPGQVFRGDWRKRAYITGAEHSRSKNGRNSAKLSIALLDGAWWRLQSVSLKPGSGTSDSTPGLGYNYGYEHDYTRPRSGGIVQTSSLVPCKPKFVFYGAVNDPYIIIAGNKYQVMGNVPSGSRIEVDGMDMTVKLIAQDGTVTDKFSSALRGSGEGGGEYIFQPIPPGALGVTWDDSFGVDICWYEEEGEPPWSQS